MSKSNNARRSVMAHRRHITVLDLTCWPFFRPLEDCVRTPADRQLYDYPPAEKPPMWPSSDTWAQYAPPPGVTVGFIPAEKIVAGSITADKLVVS